jgi:hypothetical protein
MKAMVRRYSNSQRNQQIVIDQPGDDTGKDQNKDNGHGHPDGGFHFFGGTEKRAVAKKLGQEDIVDENAADDEDDIVTHGRSPICYPSCS